MIVSPKPGLTVLHPITRTPIAAGHVVQAETLSYFARRIRSGDVIEQAIKAEKEEKK